MFKVGDIVRVIATNPRCSWGDYVRRGDVGVVRMIPDYPDFCMYVDFPNHEGWAGYPDEFEYATPPLTHQDFDNIYQGG